MANSRDNVNMDGEQGGSGAASSAEAASSARAESPRSVVSVVPEEEVPISDCK